MGGKERILVAGDQLGSGDRRCGAGAFRSGIIQGRELRAVRGQVQPQLDSIITRTRRALDSVLTPEQRKRAEAIRKRHPPPPGPPPGEFPGGPDRPEGPPPRPR